MYRIDRRTEITHISGILAGSTFATEPDVVNCDDPPMSLFSGKHLELCKLCKRLSWNARQIAGRLLRTSPFAEDFVT